MQSPLAHPLVSIALVQVHFQERPQLVAGWLCRARHGACSSTRPRQCPLDVTELLLGQGARLGKPTPVVSDNIHRINSHESGYGLRMLLRFPAPGYHASIRDRFRCTLAPLTQCQAQAEWTAEAKKM